VHDDKHRESVEPVSAAKPYRGDRRIWARRPQRAKEGKSCNLRILTVRLSVAASAKEPRHLIAHTVHDMEGKLLYTSQMDGTTVTSSAILGNSTRKKSMLYLRRNCSQTMIAYCFNSVCTSYGNCKPSSPLKGHERKVGGKRAGPRNSKKIVLCWATKKSSCEGSRAVSAELFLRSRRHLKHAG
jgi:hypothetical protein